MAIDMFWYLLPLAFQINWHNWTKFFSFYHTLFFLFLTPECTAGLSQAHKLGIICIENISLFWANKKNLFCARSISAVCSGRHLHSRAQGLSSSRNFSALNNGAISSKLTANLNKSCCVIHLNSLLLQILPSEREPPTSTSSEVNHKNTFVHAYVLAAFLLLVQWIYDVIFLPSSLPRVKTLERRIKLLIGCVSNFPKTDSKFTWVR